MQKGAAEAVGSRTTRATQKTAVAEGRESESGAAAESAEARPEPA